MTRRTHRYRFPNGARLATGLYPSVVPPWGPTQFSIPITRHSAAVTLWQHRRRITRIS